MSDHFKKGSIIAERAYAQGKMIDHSSWNFTNGRTFSDIDAAFDNNGSLLYVEFARSEVPLTWSDISTGQRWLYKSALANKPGSIAVLACHNVPSDQQINSKSDVTHASAVSYKFTGETSLDSKQWKSLCHAWDVSPEQALTELQRLYDAQKSGGDS